MGFLMTTALVFPGQGSQAIGMAQSLAENFVEARDVLAEVDDALSFKLSALMKEGPDSDLTATQNAQPAIMAASLDRISGDAKTDGFYVACGRGFCRGPFAG
jgi:[acyl-carrier-protein] S-malonyltransferase